MVIKTNRLLAFFCSIQLGNVRCTSLFFLFFFAFLLLLQVNALRLKTYWSRSIVNVWMYISAKTITWLKAHRHSMTFLTTKGTVEQKWICFCFFVLFASHVPPACKQRCTFTWKSRELSDTHISANYRTLNFKYIYISLLKTTLAWKFVFILTLDKL